MMGQNDRGEVVELKVEEPKVERPKVISDRIHNFIDMFKQMTKEELDDVKKILGPLTIMNITKGTRSGSRVNGSKVQRTDKVLEKTFAKQMQLLINVLPKSPTDIAAWTKLALESGLETQQEPTRITAYYRKQIIDMGYAEEVK